MAASATDTVQRPAGIVTGLQLEARIARRRAGAARTLCLGMGPRRAREAAEALIAEGAAGLVSFGMAAGLVAEATPGLIVVPATIRTGNGQEMATDMVWRERLLDNFRRIWRCTDAPLAGVRRPLSDYLDKARVWAATQAVAADMESAAVATVARQARVPFVVVRAVADPAGFPLPPAALAAVDEGGRLDPLALLRALWRRPRQIRALRELAAHSRAARRALDRVARVAGPNFGLQLAAPRPDFRRPIAHTRR